MKGILNKATDDQDYYCVFFVSGFGPPAVEAVAAFSSCTETKMKPTSTKFATTTAVIAAYVASAHQNA